MARLVAWVVVHPSIIRSDDSQGKGPAFLVRGQDKREPINTAIRVREAGNPD
jgi:hypothetical protein